MKEMFHPFPHELKWVLNDHHFFPCAKNEDAKNVFPFCFLSHRCRIVCEPSFFAETFVWKRKSSASGQLVVATAERFVDLWHNITKVVQSFFDLSTVRRIVMNNSLLASSSHLVFFCFCFLFCFWGLSLLRSVGYARVKNLIKCLKPLENCFHSLFTLLTL